MANEAPPAALAKSTAAAFQFACLLQSNGETGSEREIAVLTNAEWLTSDVHLAVDHGGRGCNPWVCHADALVQWLHSSEG